MEIKKLRELPGFKEKLNDVNEKLKNLENTKDSVSDKTYNNLKEQYESTLKKLKKKINSYETKANKEKIELKEKLENVNDNISIVDKKINEIRDLLSKNIIDKNEAKKELKKLKKVRKKNIKKSNIIKSKIENINKYMKKNYKKKVNKSHKKGIFSKVTKSISVIIVILFLIIIMNYLIAPNKYIYEIINLNLKKGNNKKEVVKESMVERFIDRNFIKVKGGIYKMGTNYGESNESPQHKVRLESFHILKHEITQKLYKKIMGENPSKFIGNKRPVENISWYDAIKFCNKLSEKYKLNPVYKIYGDDVTCNWDNNGFRLPTEAEWEYAARGANRSNNYKYSGSNTPYEVAWYKENANGRTHDVETKAPNEIGAYDMSGNVYEWCWDWADDEYYKVSKYSNPKGPKDGEYKIFRGGCYANKKVDIRNANRRYYYPSYHKEVVGFRIVKNIN